MTDAFPKPVASREGHPALFLLHYLGGSAGSWQDVIRRIGSVATCHAIDLPGFGDAAHLEPRSVAEMADYVAAAVRETARERWFIVGHSMGAKIATVVARRAEDGEPGLSGLCGLVLVAGSPPAPEPMDEEQRQIMLGWFAGDAVRSTGEASRFVSMNVGAPLEEAPHARAVADVVRMDRAAWQAWLERGSREDWASCVGRLDAPTLIISGDKDADLGPEAQSRLMERHFRRSRSIALDGAGHLLPIERSAAVAELIRTHVLENAGNGILLPDAAYLGLIQSDRVSARTRGVLIDRARRDDPERQPAVLSRALYAVLTAVVDRVVPQRSSPTIDLAARIDAALAANSGDGWRFAALPPDAAACRAGLATLEAAAMSDHGMGFADLDGAGQDGLLQRSERGEIGWKDDPHLLSDDRMRLWFEDLRAVAVRLYVAHPATLARLGYSGLANGGDGPRKQGFVETKADRPEPWEPRGTAGVRP